MVRDMKDAMPWPIPRKLLGENPFVGLVPAGHTFTTVGVGGFLGPDNAFFTVDKANRADLPKSADGEIKLYGSVSIIAPSLMRITRGQASGGTTCLMLIV